jgi:hypothetical protein
MPDIKIPPQTPERPEKRSRSRQRRRSRHSSQEIDSLKLSDNLNQNATASQGPSSPEGVPSTPESAMPEEHSPQLNNNMASVDSHLPARSPACTIEENPQHASPAPKIATPPEAVTGPSSSFISGSSPEADTQHEGFDQACLHAACTHPTILYAEQHGFLDLSVGIRHEDQL